MVLSNVKYDRIRPFMVASIATLIAVVTATMATSGWASAQGTDPPTPTPTPEPTAVATVEPTEEPPGEPKPDAPAGQLVRRGLSGKVLPIEGSEFDGSEFLIETRHGLVKVIVTGETTINQPPNGPVGMDSLQIGDRVGILLAKPENDNATPSAEADVFRTATALKIVIVPSKATREHRRAIVLEKIKNAIKDRVKFIDRNGDEVEIETDVEIEGEEGEEVLLVTRRGKDGDDHVSSSARAEKIEERLRELARKRADLEGKLEEVREKFNARRAELLDTAKEKIARLEIGDDIKARIDEARAKAQARVDEARLIVQIRVDEARANAQARIDEARANTAGRVDEARDKNQERADEARDKFQGRVDEALANAERLTPEQREKALARIAEAREDADERIKNARAAADERIKKAREDAQKRIAEARDAADKRIKEARENADDRIENARDEAAKRLEEARKKAAERRANNSDASLVGASNAR
jgi:vacuolar-type H+-ATPase subunit H